MDNTESNTEIPEEMEPFYMLAVYTLVLWL